MTVHLTPRGLAGLAAAALLGCSAAGPRHESDPFPTVSFGKRGEGRAFANICRYESTGLPPVLSVFELTADMGGLTCFTDDGGVLFIPRREDACPRLADLQVAPPQVLTQGEAAQEYLRCSAIALPPSSGPSQLAIYRPNRAHPQGDDLFPGFVLDAGALVSNDMLPVTLFLPGGGFLCMESPDVRRAARRIAEADIADPSEVTVEFATGSCLDMASEF